MDGGKRTLLLPGVIPGAKIWQEHPPERANVKTSELVKDLEI